MKITIELCTGPDRRPPRVSDIDKNIEALQRAIDGKPFASDFVLLHDTLSILEALRQQLP